MSDEYISRQEMIDAVDHLHIIPSIDGTGKPTPTEDFRVQFIGTVLKVKSADVAPTKYGEWISIPEMWGAFDVRYYCSKCGKDAIINNSERYVLSDYCPHCGAIMVTREETRMADEYIRKQDAIHTIMGHPPDAHYPDWYASQIEDIPAADVAPVETLKAEIYKLKCQQDSKNQDYYIGYMSALSTVEGILAWMDEKE